ncbi:MAG: right-handed parallel beta-helix repeat-containing protein, partial [Candidatus Eisenbacteria bacterium]|nr:right-handed parallel beta-helix repeat-containing protein [Candidatus Eisenbacteria bacterium]
FVDNDGIAGLRIGECYANCEVSHCRFSSNSTGLAVFHEDDGPGVYTVADCLFSENGLGAEFRNEGGQMNVDRCAFVGNDQGANLHSAYALTLASCVFEQNGTGSSIGGGLQIAPNASVQLSDCRFIGNTAQRGGALRLGGGVFVQMSECAFECNEATGRGGAIDAEEAGLIATDCVFSGNRSGERGGAIADGYSTQLHRCLLLENAALTGSAISTLEILLEITESTIAKNVGPGPVVDIQDAAADFGEIHLDHCTVVANQGSRILTLGTGSIDNSIVAFNQGVAVECVGAVQVTTQCSDIYGNTGGDWAGCIADQEGQSGNISESPLFCDWTHGDYALSSGSPCLSENDDPMCPTMGAYPDPACAEPAPATWLIRPDGSGFLPTIQAALDIATDRDTVLLSDGIFAGPGNRDLDLHGKAIVVRSRSDDPGASVIECGGSPGEPHRGFTFTSGEGDGSVIEGITITGGAAFGMGTGRFGGAVYCAESSPTIRRCVIEGNVAERNGGGINLFHSAMLVDQCVIRNNEAPLGGGVNSSSSSAIIRGTQITGNRSIESGGGIRYFAQLSESPRLESSTLSANTAEYGGGLSCEDAVSLEIERTVIWGDCAGEPAGQGGEIWLGSASTIVSCGCSDVDVSGVDFGDPVAQFLFEDGDNQSADPLFCIPLACESAPSAEGGFTVDSASPCLPEMEGCGLIGAFGQGCDGTSSLPGNGTTAPLATLFLSCAPNPFSDATTLRFGLSNGGPVDLAIFDVSGKRIRALVRGDRMSMGPHTLVWDGLGDMGERVPHGVYWCRLMAGSRSVARRLVVISQ